MWKKDLPSASTSLGNLFVFDWIYFIHLLSFLFSIWITTISFGIVVWFKKDSLNQPPVNVLVFADFNIQLKVSLTHSGKLCYNSRSPLTLLRLLIFLIQCLNVMLRLVLFMIHFYFPNLVFVLQWSSLHWRILFNLLSQFPLISV